MHNHKQNTHLNLGLKLNKQIKRFHFGLKKNQQIFQFICNLGKLAFDYLEKSTKLKQTTKISGVSNLDSPFS